MNRLVEKYQQGDGINLKGIAREKVVNPDGSVTYKRTYAGQAIEEPINGGDKIPGGEVPGGSGDPERDKAFAEARADGLPSFTYKGKEYSTEIAGNFKDIMEQRVSHVPAPLEGQGLPEQTAAVTPQPGQLQPRKEPNKLHELVDFQWAGGLGESKSTMNMQEGHVNRYAVNQRDHAKKIFDSIANPEDLSTEEGTRRLIAKTNKEFNRTYKPLKESEKFRGQLQFTGRGLK